MENTLKHSINAQRARLTDLLGTTLVNYAKNLPPFMADRQALDLHLRQLFSNMQHCKYLYVLDATGVQISSTVNRYGAEESHIGRDRSERPYMQHMHHENIDFNLSEAYISRNKKRPSVTGIQTIRDAHQQRIGFLGVDYDLRELPHSDVMYEEPHQWRQIKGDPAIRGGLFLQERVESLMDQHIDQVSSVHEALILDHGVHHIQIHFSSSRSTLWHRDDPFVYRLLTMEELSDPGVCMAYPRRDYFERAIVPPSDIAKIFRQFKELRFADETIYLRSASLNIVNGKVGLNFSCDGTHYLNYDEFLSKGLEFWFGAGEFPQTVEPAEEPSELDIKQLDSVLEELAGMGCMKVNQLLYAMEKGEVPEVMEDYNSTERDYLYKELKSVMDVYDGGVCGI